MSVISFPRRIESPRPRSSVAPRRAPAAATPKVQRLHRRPSATRRSVVAIAVAVALSMAGSMWAANRQIEIHTLQAELLQSQSNYAVQVGSLTNLSAPSQIATKAGALHLVSPIVVLQISTTSLDTPLPLPKFSGYAPAVSRTNR